MDLWISTFLLILIGFILGYFLRSIKPPRYFCSKCYTIARKRIKFYELCFGCGDNVND